MLLTPPVLAPLTLAEAKLRAGLDWPAGDPREAQMTRWLQTAVSQVERDTGIALLEQTHVDGIVREALTCRSVMLSVRPVVSVVITDAIGTVFADDLYTVEPSSVDPTPARLRIASGGYWPEGLVATIVAGFQTVEDLQAHAPLLVDAVGILVAHLATSGRDRFTEMLTRDEYLDKISSYQLVTLA